MLIHIQKIPQHNYFADRLNQFLYLRRRYKLDFVNVSVGIFFRGGETESYEHNCVVFVAVQRYIIATERLRFDCCFFIYQYRETHPCLIRIVFFVNFLFNILTSFLYSTQNLSSVTFIFNCYHCYHLKNKLI